MKALKRVLNVIIDILIAVVLVVSIFVAVSALTSKASGMPTVFGYTFQTIQSDSMKGGSDEYDGGDFEKGDLIICRTVGFEASAEYDVGDIVVYRGYLEGAEEVGEQLICHRIVGKEPREESYIYKLKGDNPEAQKIDEVPPSSIAAKYYTNDYQGKRLKGWGAPLDYIKTQQGFFFAVLLPMIIFFMYALVRVVLSATTYKKSKADEEKQEAVDAAVAAALAAQQNGAAAPVEAQADAPAMSAEELEQFRQFQEFQKLQKAQQEAQNASAEPQTAEDTPSKE